MDGRSRYGEDPGFKLVYSERIGWQFPQIGDNRNREQKLGSAGLCCFKRMELPSNQGRGAKALKLKQHL
jgi:hypothetical protein